MRSKLGYVLAVALVVPMTVSAQAIKEIPLPPSQNPSNTVLPISGAVWAGNTLYVSGWLDPDMKADTDTKSQVVGIFNDIQKLLRSQQLTLDDVVTVHVYLGNNPATAGKPDFEGLTAGYTQFFGTKDQPNKPARTTVQVVLPAASRGALVEVDLVAQRSGNPSLAGTWTLVAADRELPDGTRSHDYGDHPLGRMMIDESGRYSIQIYRSDVPRFASGDPAKGTPEEYKAAFDGSSVHYGEMTVDWGTHTLRMMLDESTDPNRRGRVQTRPFTLDGDVLSYRVPRRPDGTVPISVWRRDQ